MAHVPTAAPPTAPAPSPFEPYVPASKSLAEFTPRAIVLGALFGLLFGASTVYLGLRAGLTVSASIPIAVLAISVLKRLGGSTILENNIVQTIGSAGESLASGVVFTIPALIFLLPYGPGYFNYLQILLLAFAGGILGVLMMVPLRRALIVKEHGVLPYPEGTACADVLVAGERGGALAGTVFMGLGVGDAVEGAVVDRSDVPHRDRLLDAGAQLLPERDGERRHLAGVHGRRLCDRPAHRRRDVRRRCPVVAGPASRCCRFSASTFPVPFPPVPASGLKLSEMAPGQIWSAYIRYIGAGAVLASGLITLGRTLPTIVASFRESMKGLGRRPAAPSALRTDRDLPLMFVIVGSLVAGIVPRRGPEAADLGQPAGRAC